MNSDPNRENTNSGPTESGNDCTESTGGYTGYSAEDAEEVLKKLEQLAISKKSESSELSFETADADNQAEDSLYSSDDDDEYVILDEDDYFAQQYAVPQASAHADKKSEKETEAENATQAVRKDSSKSKKRRKPSKHPLLKIFVSVTLIVILICTGCFSVVYRKLGLINFSGKEEGTTAVMKNEQIIYDDGDYEMMSAIETAYSLKDYLYQWANNGGELMTSKNVINVLLIGLDNEDALENGGRSDVQMIVSLNKKTREVNLSSVFRDTWVYMNVDGKDRYTKINASYFYGGPEGTVKTIEDNFKIGIDFYAAVDFTAFVDIINALGGITVEVQQYEAEYINRTTVHTIDYGPAVLLDGWEALVFARIRHSDADSDISRTRRQREVITSLMSELKNASFSEINNAVNTLFKYIQTDITKTQILTYATQALTYNWMDYPIKETSLSEPDILKTGYVGKAAAVFMDLPLAAYTLQNGIYGESNIVLDEDRSVIFNLVTIS